MYNARLEEKKDVARKRKGDASPTIKQNNRNKPTINSKIIDDI